MFKNLSERLTGIFDRLKSRGSLTESDVDLALREVRIAFLEADVALEVVKEFLEKAKKKAVGSKIVKSISPSQMVIKIVNDTLKEILGDKEEPINLKATPPVILLMVGLQGSGKTTTSAKIAKKLKDKDKKKVLMSSLDVQRPAAQEQLATLGKQVDVPTVEIIKGEKPIEIAGRSLDQAKKEGFDVFGFDISQDAISFVEECRIAENLGNLKVVVHDITKPLDFNSEFDLIYSNLALQFFDLKQLGAIFDNINKIMQKNTLFLFSTKKSGDKYHNFGTKINDDTFEYNRIKRYFFDQDSLRALLEKNFKILIFDSAQHENLDKSVSKWWKILVQKK